MANRILNIIIIIIYHGIYIIHIWIWINASEESKSICVPFFSLIQLVFCRWQMIYAESVISNNHLPVRFASPVARDIYSILTYDNHIYIYIYLSLLMVKRSTRFHYWPKNQMNKLSEANSSQNPWKTEMKNREKTRKTEN